MHGAPGAQGDPQATAEQRGALAQAGRGGQLAAFDQQAQRQSDARRAAQPPGSAACPDQQAERDAQHDLDDPQQQADPATLAGRLGQPPAPMVGGQFGLPLDAIEQQVVGKQAPAHIGHRVGHQRPAHQHRPALAPALFEPTQLRQRGRHRQGAQQATDRLGDQVVLRDRAAGEEFLRQLDRAGKDQAQADRRQHRPELPAVAPTTNQRQGAESANGQVQHPVGDPVGARFDAQRQVGQVHKSLPCLGPRQRRELERQQAAVDHEHHPTQPPQ